MKYALGALYLAGWLVTTVMLLRGGLASGEGDRTHRVVAGLVGAVCALALAAVWPISGWFLPMIRAALDDDG